METKQRDEAAGILGVFGPRPEWAQAEIVAELEQDDCDTQTDYFAVKRTHRVRLAWSRHRRDIFSELRKAAATMEETAHLGPGRDEYNVRVVFACEVSSGSVYANAGWESPYHRDLARSFTTQAEADAYVAEQPALGEMSMGEQGPPSAGTSSARRRAPREVQHGSGLLPQGRARLRQRMDRPQNLGLTRRQRASTLWAWRRGRTAGEAGAPASNLEGHGRSRPSRITPVPLNAAGKIEQVKVERSMLGGRCIAKAQCWTGVVYRSNKAAAADLARMNGCPVRPVGRGGDHGEHKPTDEGAVGDGQGARAGPRDVADRGRGRRRCGGDGGGNARLHGRPPATCATRRGRSECPPDRCRSGPAGGPAPDPRGRVLRHGHAPGRRHRAPRPPSARPRAASDRPRPARLT